MKKALVLGVPGQDGCYWAEILLEKGYEVPALFCYNEKKVKYYENN